MAQCTQDLAKVRIVSSEHSRILDHPRSGFNWDSPSQQKNSSRPELYKPKRGKLGMGASEPGGRWEEAAAAAPRQTKQYCAKRARA